MLARVLLAFGIALTTSSAACWSPELGTTARVLPRGTFQGQLIGTTPHAVGASNNGRSESYTTFLSTGIGLRGGLGSRFEFGARALPTPTVDVKYAPIQTTHAAVAVMAVGQYQFHPFSPGGAAGWFHAPLLVTLSDAANSVALTLSGGPSWAIGDIFVEHGNFGGHTAMVRIPPEMSFNGGLGRVGVALTFNGTHNSFTPELVYLRSYDRNVELFGGAFTWSFGHAAKGPGSEESR